MEQFCSLRVPSDWTSPESCPAFRSSSASPMDRPLPEGAQLRRFPVAHGCRFLSTSDPIPLGHPWRPMRTTFVPQTRVTAAESSAAALCPPQLTSELLSKSELRATQRTGSRSMRPNVCPPRTGAVPVRSARVVFASTGPTSHRRTLNAARAFHDRAINHPTPMQNL